MKNFITGFILGVAIATPIIAYATFYDSGQEATRPILAVGKQSDGTYTAVQVDSSGVVQITS